MTVSINTQTGTSYTTVAGDDGKVIECDNGGAAFTLTIHSSAAVGFHGTVVQTDNAQVQIVAGGSGNVRNHAAHEYLSGQWASLGFYVRANPGSAPEVVIFGITSP